MDLGKEIRASRHPPVHAPGRYRPTHTGIHAPANGMGRAAMVKRKESGPEQRVGDSRGRTFRGKICSLRWANAGAVSDISQ